MNSDNPWHLVSLRSGQHGVPKRDEQFVAPEEEAVKLVAQGNAWPIETPNEPPQNLLSMLKGQVSKIDLLGPATKDPSRQAEIAQDLFPNGLRQDFAGGRAIHWLQGKTGLRKLVGSRLSDPYAANFDLFALFRFVTFETPSRWRFPSKDCYSQIYGQEYAREVPGDLEDFSVDLHTQTRWWRQRVVILDALCLQGQLESLVAQALSDGRILVAEMARAGERFIPAKVAGNMHVRDFTRRHSFALSSDLPEVQVRPDAPLDSKRKQAARAIEAIYAHYRGSGRCFTATDIQILIAKRYNLKPNAAKAAWKLAKVPAHEFKNIPQKQKVKICEFERLNIIERENGDPPDIH